MLKTAEAIIRGLAAVDPLVKTASHEKLAAQKRWLEDSDLVKLCGMCRQARPKAKK